MVSLFRPSPLFGRNGRKSPPTPGGVWYSAGDVRSITGNSNEPAPVFSETIYSSLNIQKIARPRYLSTYFADCVLAIVDGRLYSMGSNTNYRTARNTSGGTTTTLSLSNSPLTGITDISVGHNTAFLLKDGNSYAWGINGSAGNNYGWLGLGPGVGYSQVRQLPVIQSSFGDITHISAGLVNGAFVRSDGGIYTWGHNGAGRNGSGGTSGLSHTPTLRTTLSNVSKIVCGLSFIVIIADGNLYATGSPSTSYGSPTQFNSFTLISDSGDWEDIAVFDNGCIAIRGGALWSVGTNATGQLGLGDTTSRSSWTLVDSTKTWTKVSASMNSCAAIGDGHLYTWGSRFAYSTGQGTDSEGPDLVPTLADDSRTWTDVEMGVRGTWAKTAP